MTALFRTSDRIDVTNEIHLTVIDRSDAVSLVKYLNDDDFYRNSLSIPYPYRLSDADIFIDAVIAFEKKHGKQRDWAIRNKQGEQIGGIGLLYNHGIDAHKSEIGYWLAKSYWNQGLMTDVVKAFAQFLFETRSLLRLEAMVFEHNTASCRVLEKAGFTKEGLIKSAFLKDDDQQIDAHLYALIKEHLHSLAE